jgi:tetratricopeptide (TPR) repeat protein
MGATFVFRRFQRLRAVLIVALVVSASASRTVVARGAEENASEVLERAREAAAADRHREAIDLYRLALKRDSLLVSTLSIEMGHQYTWAEIPDSAVKWYEVYLSYHPGDAEGELGLARALSWGGHLKAAATCYEGIGARGDESRQDALLGLAKVRRWQEDYDAAAGAYEQVLSADSGNVDAKIGLAESLNLAGKNRAARDRYEAILADDPGNQVAVEGLARAYLWSGRPDLAEETLAKGRATDPGRGPYEMDGVLDSMKRPRGSAFTSFRKTTSDGEMRTVGASATFTRPRFLEWTLLCSNSRLHQSGYPDIHRNDFAATMSRRFSDLVGATVSAGYELNRFNAFVVPPGPGTADSFDLFVWDAFATLYPRDWVRVDIATNREAMEIPLPVFKRVHVTTESIGLDWRLRYRCITFWKAGYSAYSDGNSRMAATERVEWVSPWQPPETWRTGVVLLQGLEYTNFSKQLDNGYFSPDNDVYIYGGIRLASAGGGRFGASVEGRFGGEKESGAEWVSVGSFDVALRYRIQTNAVLSGGFYKSGSRLDSADGFRAEGVYLTLDLGGSP